MTALDELVARIQYVGAELDLYAFGVTAGALLVILGGLSAACAVVAVLLAGGYALRQRDRRRRPRLEVDLRGCARCGGDHPVEFLKLVEPVPDAEGPFTHWAPCPNLGGEPILMRDTATTA